MARPWIIGHRGVTDGTPENTLAAFEAALERAADGIELDLQLSRDGVPVVFHHRTLFRAGLRGRRIFHLDLAALRRLVVRSRTGRNASIPTLEEVLARYGHRTRLFLEVKARPRVDTAARHQELVEKVAAAVGRHGVADRVCLLSFNRAVLDSCCEVGLQLRTCLNLKRPIDLAAPHVLDGLFAVCLAVRHLTPAYVEEIHRRGLACFTFTCDSPRTARRAITAGVDAILTGRPAWLASYLDAHGVAG